VGKKKNIDWEGFRPERKKRAGLFEKSVAVPIFDVSIPVTGKI